LEVGLSRGDLTEAEWRILKGLLPIEPENRGQGRPPEGNRSIVNGIPWRLRCGAPWRNVPPKYGSWNTIYRQFRRWSEAGVWETVAATLAKVMPDTSHYSIDSTTVRAHHLAERRRRWDCRFKLERQSDLRDRVRDGLAMGWSPEQIAGRFTLENGRTLISPESIYRFIYHRSAQKDYWHRLLPRAKHKRGRPGRFGGSMVDIIKHRRPLSERPAEVQDRQRPGHWEADFMLFAQCGQSILVAHDAVRGSRSSSGPVIERPRQQRSILPACSLPCAAPSPSTMA
jgi:transposase